MVRLNNPYYLVISYIWSVIVMYSLACRSLPRLNKSLSFAVVQGL